MYDQLKEVASPFDETVLLRKARACDVRNLHQMSIRHINKNLADEKAIFQLEI